jgi:hypothetical protein
MRTACALGSPYKFSLDLLTLETTAVDLYLGNMLFKFNQVY